MTAVSFPTKGINKYVSQYISVLKLKGKRVLDIPCGDGRATYELLKRHAEVIPLDLYPEFLKISDITAQEADLSEALPLENEKVDYIVCQEGIEHIPNQLYVLQEFNRVLKKDGELIVTTPNASTIRSKLSWFLFETDLWKRLPPTEIDSVWFSEKNSRKLYFGHLFLTGVQHFQTLCTFSGFKVTRRHITDISYSSVFWGIFSYPVILFFTILSFLLYKNKNKQIEKTQRYKALWERVKLNLSFKTLFCKHIFWSLKKEYNVDEVINKLRDMKRCVE